MHKLGMHNLAANAVVTRPIFSITQSISNRLRDSKLFSIIAISLFLSACGGSSSSPNRSAPNDTNNTNLGPNLPAPPANIAALECLPQPTPNLTFSVKPENVSTNHDMLIQTALSPGQSGFLPSAATCATRIGSDCSVAPDQDAGTYDPHLDDQRLMYWRSEFKPGAFMDISNATPEHTLNITTPVTDTVTIYRDPFGVPVVYADTEFGVWYGHGYALAEDRLFLLDQARRQARGTSGEVLGAGAVSADVMTRTLTYTEAEYMQIKAELNNRARAALDGQVAGANLRIAEVNAGGTGAARNSNPLMPQEYVALQYDPTPINDIDLMALGVLITRFVASNGGDEMENVKALQALEAMHGKEVGRQIFKDVLWVDDKKADVTIPDQEFTNISTPLALRDEVFEAQADYASALPVELADGSGTGAYEPPIMSTSMQRKVLAQMSKIKWPVKPEILAKKVKEWQQLPERISASYMMIASPDITEGNQTLLVNGPQLGYSYPSLLAEVEVHGAGFDARGVTVPGLPVVGIGYGERTVWGLTTGESKTIDSFIVEVTSADGKQYLHDGQTKTMECRMETFNYRSASQGAPNVAEPVPGANQVELEVCRTVHGPVVARSDDGQLARAVEYAMWLKEVDTVEGVLEWNRVDTFSEFREAMKKVTWNENTMYADADGNVAYFHPGLHQWRHPATDQRLPNRGDGSQDTCDQLVFDNRPQSINPARGYLHNWNNKPSAGWGDGVGGVASQEPSAADGRNVNWGPLIEAELNGDGLTYDDLVEIDKRIGRIAPIAAALLPSILACDNACNLSAEEQALIDILKTWDMQHYNDAIDIEAMPSSDDPTDPSQPDGVLDTPAATIFSEIAQAMVDEITTDSLPAEFITRHSIRGNHPYDAGTFHKLMAKILDPNKSTIPTTFDWTQGRNQAQFVNDAIGIALTRMQTTYDSTDPNDFKRIHARADVCALASPLAGPCITMPHQDRGSWLKLVGFIPD